MELCMHANIINKQTKKIKKRLDQLVGESNKISLRAVKTAECAHGRLRNADRDMDNQIARYRVSLEHRCSHCTVRHIKNL